MLDHAADTLAEPSESLTDKGAMRRIVLPCWDQQRLATEEIHQRV
jgi:hypothetical protein